VRTGAAVGTGFDILGEGHLDSDQLATGALQSEASLLQTDTPLLEPPGEGRRLSIAAFVRFQP
jgi:hypothetical protein